MEHAVGMTGLLVIVAVVAVGLLLARELVAVEPAATQARTARLLGWGVVASVTLFAVLLLLRLSQILSG